jgi:fumarate reductase flavoprotein subunit
MIFDGKNFVDDAKRGIAWLRARVASLSKKGSAAKEIAEGEIITGATLEELAENIRKSNGGEDAPNFDTAKFIAAIDAYNKRYDAGEDADYGRPFATMVPVKTGPFYALKTCPYVMLTKGGPLMTTDAQTINMNDEPIVGLYQAGEFVGGANLGGSANIGGLANTTTIVWGRIAGQSAAAYAASVK